MARSRISIVMEDKEKVLWKLNFGKNLASIFQYCSQVAQQEPTVCISKANLSFNFFFRQVKKVALNFMWVKYFNYSKNSHMIPRLLARERRCDVTCYANMNECDFLAIANSWLISKVGTLSSVLIYVLEPNREISPVIPELFFKGCP